MAFSFAQHAHMIVEFVKSLTIKSKTMAINQEDLKLLVEQIIDFDSSNQNGYDSWSYFRVQEWSSFFDMLNEPTYPHLVRDFWVRAEVLYELSVSMEQSLLIQNDKSLKAKSGEEMVLKKF
ncbi:unnamed protein product [Lathyrus oleraceus]